MSLPLSASVPSTPTHTIGNTLNMGTSDYFTEPEVERNSTASSSTGIAALAVTTILCVGKGVPNKAFR